MYKILFLMLLMFCCCCTKHAYVVKEGGKRKYYDDSYLEYGKDTTQVYFKQQVRYCSYGCYKLAEYKATMPKGIVRICYTGCDFGFRYKSKQQVIVRTEIPSMDSSDCEGEVSDEFVSSVYLSMFCCNKKIFNDDEIDGRCNYMFKRGPVTILLKNIKPENVEMFQVYAKQFKLLTRPVLEK